jgi:hypothetical protein
MIELCVYFLNFLFGSLTSHIISFFYWIESNGFGGQELPKRIGKNVVGNATDVKERGTFLFKRKQFQEVTPLFAEIICLAITPWWNCL